MRTLRRKKPARKARPGPKPARRRAPSPARLQDLLAQRTRERDEALEQQAATAEVLKVISSSPGELEPVFHAMLANATSICEAKFGTLFRYDGKLAYRVAGVGTPAALVNFKSNEAHSRRTPPAISARVPSNQGEWSTRRTNWRSRSRAWPQSMVAPDRRFMSRCSRTTS